MHCKALKIEACKTSKYRVNSSIDIYRQPLIYNNWGILKFMSSPFPILLCKNHWWNKAKVNLHFKTQARTNMKSIRTIVFFKFICIREWCFRIYTVENRSNKWLLSITVLFYYLIWQVLHNPCTIRELFPTSAAEFSSSCGFHFPPWHLCLCVFLFPVKFDIHLVIIIIYTLTTTS